MGMAWKEAVSFYLYRYIMMTDWKGYAFRKKFLRFILRKF